MSARRVLSVGQCYADHGALSRTLEKHFGAEVVSVDDAAEALARLRSEAYDLVLVNRILDRDGSQGIGLIKRIHTGEETRGVPLMLVSNYADSQREAVAAGALPGFGKAELGHPQMLSRLRPLLERPAATPVRE